MILNNISTLSDEFLAEAQRTEQCNLAVESLQKLLKGGLAVRRLDDVIPCH